MPNITSLTLIKIIPRGLLVHDVYAKDTEGNIWWCVDFGNNEYNWQLFRKAEQIELGGARGYML